MSSQIGQMQACIRTPASGCNAKCACILLPERWDGRYCVAKGLLHKTTVNDYDNTTHSFSDVNFPVRTCWRACMCVCMTCV